MGLDITWVTKAKFEDGPGCQEDAYDCGHIRFYSNSDFETVADGMKNGHYSWADKGYFSAGSYSGYSDWRTRLSIDVLGIAPSAIWNHPEDHAGKPFVELINFSDCEGCIGPETSAKLAKDFQTHREKVEKAANNAACLYYFEVYKKFQFAFEMAATGGFVKFC